MEQTEFRSTHTGKVDRFLVEVLTFLVHLDLQNREMEADVKGRSSRGKGDERARPSELHFLSAEKSTRFSCETVYSPVTELSVNLGGLSTDTG